MNITILFLIWAVVVAVTGGVFNSVLKPRGYTYDKGYVLTTLYFTTFAILTFALFRPLLLDVIPLFGSAYLVVFGALVLAGFFVQQTMHYVLSKGADVLFQQIAIVALIILLSRVLGGDVAWVSMWYGLVFGVFHLPLLWYLGWRRGQVFVIAALCSAVLFPWLVLSFEYGFVYSYVVHWAFYMLIAPVLSTWLKFNISY